MNARVNIEYDYSKLKGRITEKLGTQRAFAKAMGMSERTCTLKLNNRAHFTQPEIHRACKPDILDIECVDIPAYFFTLKVQSA